MNRERLSAELQRCFGRRAARLLQNTLVLVMLAALAGHAGAQEDHDALALDLVNDARAAEGLEPLAATRTLAGAAQAHADDMLSRDYYAHASPEGETVRDRFLQAGGSAWRLVGENIAVCRGCAAPPGPDRVREFQEGWMASPEHRATILDPGLDEFGFGMASAESVVYAVQTFAGPGASAGDDGTAGAAAPEDLAARALAAVNAAREEGGLDPLSASPG